MTRIRTTALLTLSLIVLKVTLAKTVDCGTKYSIPNGYANFVGRNTTYKAQVPVTCNTGYELKGDNQTTCQQDGQWSKKTSCNIRNCSNSYKIENGHVDFTGRPTTYGQIAPVICKEGYEVHGDPFIACQADGKWSHDTTCQIKDCGTDYKLENGFLDFKGKTTTVGKKVPLFCNDGYELEGNSDATCLSDGKWSMFTKCRSIDCGTQYTIQNGYANFTGRKTTFENTVPVFCHAGYDLIGDRYTKCQADGNWNKDRTCRIKDCGNKTSIDFGYATFIDHSTTYGSRVPVVCQPGYEIEGDKTTTCLSNGTWSRNTVCKLKDCGAKYSLDNGHVNFNGKKTTYGEKFPVSCNEGYEIQGDSEITCLANGNWSQFTLCRIKDCGSGHLVTNGYAEFSGKSTTFGSSVPVKCSTGYTNTGDDHITCQANGSWTSHTACQIKDCGTQYNISNGRVDFEGKDTTYNNIVPVLCNPGFEVRGGDEFITCQSDGTWSTVECHPIDCGTQYQLDNGHADFSGKDTTFDHAVQVVCDRGYEIHGEDHITCRPDGKWSQCSRCQIKDCGTRYTLDNGFANFNGKDTTFNHSVPVMCNLGYAMFGDPYITCLDTGVWSNSTTCLIEDCGNKYHLENGKVDFAGYSTKYNQKVPVSCDSGYDLVGEPYITCKAGGKWSSSTSCKIKDCGTNYDLDHGKVNFDGNPTTYRSKFSITCLEGYDLRGDSYTTCLASGNWSKNTHCEPKDCGKTYAVAHGNVDFTGQDTAYPNKISVHCDAGYENHGQTEITCLATGKWSTDSTCQIKDCGASLIIEHGAANFSTGKTEYKSSVPVSCDPGYDLHGDKFSTCQANGTWSKNTKCVIKDCGHNFDIPNGHVNFTDVKTTFDAVILVICDEGYAIQDGFEPHIICQPDGTWSNHTYCKANAKYQEPSRSRSSGSVVGGVIGGIMALVAVAVVIVLMWRNQKLCFVKKNILAKEFSDLEDVERLTM